MKADTSKMCSHKQSYDTNSRILYASLTSNCMDCFLQLYTNILNEKNIQIHQLKVFEKIYWKRGVKRLHKVRNCYDVSVNCSSLGIDCESSKHTLKCSKEIPVGLIKDKKSLNNYSFICFPKYRGDTETDYKKQVNRRKLILHRSLDKTTNYLSSSRVCFECGTYFPKRKDLTNHLQAHVDAHFGVPMTKGSWEGMDIDCKKIL